MSALVDKLARADWARRLYSLLPDQTLDALPQLPLRGMDGGNGGMIRGWGLQFGPLRSLVSRDPLYRKARRAAHGKTLVQELHRINLFLLIRFYVNMLKTQDIAEIGVYHGGNAFFMATLLKELYPGAKLYAFDTYEGISDSTRGSDLHVKGDFGDASLIAVRAAAKQRGLDNIEFVAGDVRETMKSFHAPLGLAHIDLAVYDPIAYAQDVLWDGLAPGGYLVYDDATFSNCVGATRAVEEFLVKHRVHSEQIFPHFVFRKSSGS
jgi:predicted O-methyltransferase YrrM